MLIFSSTNNAVKEISFRNMAILKYPLHLQQKNLRRKNSETKTKSNSVMADLMALEFLFVSYSYRLTEAVIFREVLL